MVKYKLVPKDGAMSDLPIGWFEYLLNENIAKSDWVTGDDKTISNMFDWSKSPEKHEFWSLMERLFTIEPVKEPIQINIGSRDAFVHSDGHINVGCVNIKPEVVKELIAAFEKQTQE